MGVEEFNTTACGDLHAWLMKCDGSRWNKPSRKIWFGSLLTIDTIEADIPVAFAMHESITMSSKFSGYATILSDFCQDLMEAHVDFMHESWELRAVLAPEKRSEFVEKVLQVSFVITSLIRLIEEERKRYHPSLQENDKIL